LVLQSLEKQLAQQMTEVERSICAAIVSRCVTKGRVVEHVIILSETCSVRVCVGKAISKNGNIWLNILGA